ncbi:MAG: hypothetical protein OXF55_12495 [Caldilineaceae bacterium]|nr:hypothetical protein [Caldilineaceae bacterium]
MIAAATTCKVGLRSRAQDFGALRSFDVCKLLRCKDLVADTWQGCTPERTATDHGEWLARLIGAYELLATKAGIDRLQAGTIEWIDSVGLADATSAAVTASTVVTLVLS